MINKTPPVRTRASIKTLSALLLVFAACFTYMFASFTPTAMADTGMKTEKWQPYDPQNNTVPGMQLTYPGDGSVSINYSKTPLWGPFNIKVSNTGTARPLYVQVPVKEKICWPYTSENTLTCYNESYTKWVQVSSATRGFKATVSPESVANATFDISTDEGETYWETNTGGDADGLIKMYYGTPNIYEASLTYDANGGEGAPQGKTFSNGTSTEESITFYIDAKVPTRNGYRFRGWSTDKNAEKPEYVSLGGGDRLDDEGYPYPSSLSIHFGSSVKLYAVWERTAPLDTTAPTIYGADDVTINMGTQFDVMQGVTATDDTDGDITQKIKASPSSVDTSKPGKTTVTYTVTDNAGNTATESRVVTVVNPDKTPPVIKGADDTTIQVGSDFDPMKGVTASDDTDGNITDKIKITPSTVDTSKVGETDLTYKVTDEAGNTTIVHRKIKVIAQTSGSMPQTGSATGLAIMIICVIVMATGAAMPVIMRFRSR